MKKNVIKTTVAAVCVVAAGVGGFKAYNAANQSETDMLLAENVEALSAGDSWGSAIGGAIGGTIGTYFGGGYGGLYGASAGSAIGSWIEDNYPESPEKKTRDCSQPEFVFTSQGLSSVVVSYGKQEYCEYTKAVTSCGTINSTCNSNEGQSFEMTPSQFVNSDFADPNKYSPANDLVTWYVDQNGTFRYGVDPRNGNQWKSYR